MEFIFYWVGRLFDGLDEFWESKNTQKLMGSFLVLSFVLSILVIELNRLGVLPNAIGQHLPIKHFVAIEYAFTLLLIFEVVSLVMSISLSVATSVGKQFELLSLVLLRDAFKEIAHFNEPIVWENIQPALYNIIVSACGALLIFVILGFYYRSQKHAPITSIEKDRVSFVAWKKIIALLLLGSFVSLILHNIWSFFTGGPNGHLFEPFYTTLIFSDIFIVLFSLRYGNSFRIAFRNSGFAVATVIIRLALIAPIWTGTLLGVGGALFILAVSYAYHTYTPSFYQRKLEVKRRQE